MRHENAQLAVVLQSHHLWNLDSVIIAPLVFPTVIPSDGSVFLPVRFNDMDLTLAMPFLTHVNGRRMGRSVGNLLDREDDIRRALERLFTGF